MFTFCCISRLMLKCQIYLWIFRNLHYLIEMIAWIGEIYTDFTINIIMNNQKCIKLIIFIYYAKVPNALIFELNRFSLRCNTGVSFALTTLRYNTKSRYGTNLKNEPKTLRYTITALSDVVVQTISVQHKESIRNRNL